MSKVYIVERIDYDDCVGISRTIQGVYANESTASKAVKILTDNNVNVSYYAEDVIESVTAYNTTRLELALYIPDMTEEVSLDSYYTIAESSFKLLLPPREELYYLSEPWEESWDKFGYSEGYVYIDINSNNTSLLSKARGLMLDIAYKFSNLITFDEEGFSEVDYAELEKVVIEANNELKGEK